MSRLLFKTAVLGGLMLIVGCGLLPPEPQKLYPGPPLPLDQVASVAFGGGGFLNVQSIDEIATIKPGEAHRPTKGLHVLPGSHKVVLGYSNLEDVSLLGVEMTATFLGSKQEVNLEAEAGHSYIPRVQRSGDVIRFWIEDKGKNYSEACMTESAYAKAYLVGEPLPGC